MKYVEYSMDNKENKTAQFNVRPIYWFKCGVYRLLEKTCSSEVAEQQFLTR